jgi:hypothetical protein
LGALSKDLKRWAYIEPDFALGGNKTVKAFVNTGNEAADWILGAPLPSEHWGDAQYVVSRSGALHYVQKANFVSLPNAANPQGMPSGGVTNLWCVPSIAKHVELIQLPNVQMAHVGGNTVQKGWRRGMIQPTSSCICRGDLAITKRNPASAAVW